MTEAKATGGNFLREIVEDDLRSGKFAGRVHTRFPPEPNGYLHIGHTKAIWLNFSLAADYGGRCNLRFDDTNPLKEEQEYIDAIIRDIRWLGYDWEDRLFFASDYFEQLYDWALALIQAGKAYVDDLSAEEIRAHRGSLTEPGRNSPYRDRPVAENLDLFARMRAGEFPDGARVLRARIDMASPNINLRDPVMYRILHAEHPRTGDAWAIYPLYDWAHGQSDSLEGITHSICTLEFEDHRPLYDWFLEQLDIYHPQQIEFARLNLSHTITSKRKLLQLVREGHVSGWDDPRMPTVSGMRRRGYTPEALRNFVELTGVSKANSFAELALLEHVVRDNLNQTAARAMAVLRPLRVIIENYPDDQEEAFDIPLYPQDKARQETRPVLFSRVIYIEQDDFEAEPPPKFFRLAPGREVRLLGAFYITCTDVIRDEASGEVVELRCVYDPASRGGATADGRRVKGSVHWVAAGQAVPAEVRLYDTLFSKANPDETEEGEAFTANLNPNSVEVLTGCLLEPALGQARPGDRYQFMRQGYFCADPEEHGPGRAVFNRTVSLRDTWAKLQAG
ncbi:MAG: glutamine--tRNA ligase/YqeY domain fusion protein [Candidatus Promineifilaceae bacterium]